MINIYSPEEMAKHRTGLDFRITIHLGWPGRGTVADDIECVCWMHGPGAQTINTIVVESKKYARDVNNRPIVVDELVDIYERGPGFLGIALWQAATEELERRHDDLVEAWYAYEAGLAELSRETQDEWRWAP